MITRILLLLGFLTLICGGQEVAFSRRKAVAEPVIPFSTDAIEWWDNRTSDFSLTATNLNSWTGRQNTHVLTGVTTTRPKVTVVGSQNYVGFIDDYLELDNTFFWNRTNSSLFVVMRRTGTDANDAIWHMGTNSTTDALYVSVTEQKQFNGGSLQSGFNFGHNIVTAHRIAGYSSTAIGIGNQTTNLAANTAGMITNGWLGDWNGHAFPFTGDILGVIAYNRTLTSNEMVQVQNFCSIYYRAQTNTQSSAGIWEGDSLSYGTTSTDPVYYSPAAQIAQSQVAESKYNVVATGGAEAQSVGSTRVTTLITAYARMATIYVVFNLGSNDINNGRTAVQVEGNITTLCNAYKATNPAIKIIGCTVTPRGDYNGSEETERLALNSWILGSTNFTYTCDYAADARLSNPANTTYFNGDGVHHTDAGYAVKAELMKAVLVANSLLE